MNIFDETIKKFLDSLEKHGFAKITRFLEEEIKTMTPRQKMDFYYSLSDSFGDN